MRDHTSFGYRIHQGGGDDWRWATLDEAGVVQAQGRAPTRAIAAACVIRALARAAAPGGARRAA